MKKIILFSLLIIFHFAFNVENCSAQWVQQSVPFSSGIFLDMKFVNANTGFISNSIPLFIKTTNAGYNWQIVNDYYLTSISTVDSMYIYGAGHRAGYSKLYKSTNCGLTWDSSLYAGESYGKIHFFNRDTGLICGSDGSWTYIWRTVNGGQTKDLMTTINWSTYGTLFFLKQKINGEYWGIVYNGPFWYKTTNSGVNWLAMPNVPDYPISCIFFINQDTGWATVNNYVNYVYYTTNGGNNWGTQNLPAAYYAHDIYFANPRKGWIGFGQNICATINGGVNWGMQIIPGNFSSKLFFLDSITGWAQNSWNTLAHTTNGGGTINQITNSNEQIAKNYILYQNYPNPFNPSTNIKYRIANNSFVTLKVYDIMGREIETPVNEIQKPGEYEVSFNAGKLSSGIYFYKLVAGEYSETKRMILLK